MKMRTTMPRPPASAKTHGTARSQPKPDGREDSVEGSDLQGFERYHPARHQFPKREQQVAITRAGNFSLTGDLGELLVDEGQKGWVQLAYNASKKRIAIIEASEGDVDILRISRTAKGQRYQITARRFLETYDIPLPGKGVLYSPILRLIEGKQVLFIQI
jgi:hypothetical protein